MGVLSGETDEQYSRREDHEVLAGISALDTLPSDIPGLRNILNSIIGHKEETMKYLTISTALFCGVVTCNAKTLLWEKTIVATNSLSTQLEFAVGEDGSAVIADGRGNANTIKLFDRGGALIADLPLSDPGLTGFLYVSKNEVLAEWWKIEDGYRMDLFHISEDNGVTREVMLQSPHRSLTAFNYPYLMEVSNSNSTYECKFYDLSDYGSPRVVGDAVIGVFGRNLKVRWKTLMNAKYRVQTSTDMVSWTDYTDIIDGTGSTVIVNVPLDENSDSLYVRVIRL